MTQKVKSIIYGMVTLHILGFRNLKKDADVAELAQKIQDTTGREETGFMYFYAQRLNYTDYIKFDWVDDTPDEFRSLETWWEMLQAGESEATCYDYYINNVSNFVSNEWQDAINDAHTIWKPPHERTSQETNDPNL
jgi:hypothetical protein